MSPPTCSPYWSESERSLERGSRSTRVPSMQFPTVSVSGSHSPASTVRYAVPYRPTPASTSSHSSPRFTEKELKVENLQYRVRMLEDENQRLQQRQTDIVTDANRRVEMHVTEIRMLKEDIRKLQCENKELRDLCCFLDDDRRKIRQLGKEWHKFGKYSSQLMKQEINAYQSKVREFEQRQTQLAHENEELKQLCLYLDEQRQQWMSHRVDRDAEEDRHSEDLGCGGSEKSSDSSERLKPESEQLFSVNQLKESAIRKISENAQNPASISQVLSSLSTTTTDGNERILNYIHNLESRIKQLENIQHHQDQMWPSSSDVNSEAEEKTIIETMRWRGNQKKKETPLMQQSTTSTMTSSGTTYASWDTDNESAVYVMGGEENEVPQLEVRPLPVITEEEPSDTFSKSFDDFPEDSKLSPRMATLTALSTDTTSKSYEDVLESSKLPPKMGPLSLSTLSVGRLSLCGNELMPVLRKKDRSHSQQTLLHIGSSFEKERSSSMTDAVSVLRLHELASGMPKSERDVIRPMCQAAWDNLDRLSVSLDKENLTEQRSVV